MIDVRFLNENYVEVYLTHFATVMLTQRSAHTNHFAEDSVARELVNNAAHQPHLRWGMDLPAENTALIEGKSE